ncbi:MAG: hypothetical protein KF809_01040 [Chloroflexi bacterium]|nr:hypothetical protein [Chloroflexota bacterium]
MGSLTREAQRVAAEPVYSELGSLLDQTAGGLRALTDRLRAVYAGDGAAVEPAGARDADPDLAPVRATVARLDHLARALDATRASLGATASSGGASRSGETASLSPEHAELLLEAQEQERARLAEELHDGPAQVLSNAVFRVRIVERAMRSDVAAATAELDALRIDLERETDRLRDYIRQLRPSLQDPGDLASVLTDAATQLRKEAGMEVELVLGAPEAALDLPGRTAVLRIALEALRNVRKHASARRVRLTTRLEPATAPTDADWWVLEVQDDGAGFEVEDAANRGGQRHFGLRFMRERAQLVGGGLEIVSEAAAGTTVRLRLHPRERSRTSW